MWRGFNFYSILCFACGLSVLLVLSVSRYDAGHRTPIKSSYTSKYVEKVLSITRTNIKGKLSKYDFSISGVNVLKDLVMESGGKPLQSLIVSTWRSGTKFLGGIINAIPGTYYHYEPLLKFGIIQIRGPPESNLAMSNIKDMLKCNYDGMDDYFSFGNKNMYQFSPNTRLWEHCKYKKKLCFDPEFTSRFCKLFPFHIMKVVRLRLWLIQELLEDKELNVKVILLIRDPRGVIPSRQHCDFCQPSPDCWEPSLLCADMISDYVAAGRILQQYPDRLMVLRFEELALQPNITTHRILKFLRLSATQSVHYFLKMHTKKNVRSISSTYRVSRDVPFRWKNVLDFNHVDEIQMVCKEAMLLWGYKMAHNQTHMTSKNFNPLEEYTISQ